MCINAFNILDDNLNTIGTGIYLGASVLNHSCAPNATATFDGTTLRIAAITDIEHTDPELVIIIVIICIFYNIPIVKKYIYSMFIYHIWNSCKLLKSDKMNYKKIIIFYVNVNVVQQTLNKILLTL